jgi:hypothetical protein
MLLTELLHEGDIALPLITKAKVMADHHASYSKPTHQKLLHESRSW